jgi:hypothetical protein
MLPLVCETGSAEMRAWRVERVKRSVASSALPVGGRGRKHEVGTAVTETELCANARNNGRTLHARGETQPVRQRATRNIYTTALRALRHTHLTQHTLKETSKRHAARPTESTRLIHIRAPPHIPITIGHQTCLHSSSPPRHLSPPPLAHPWAWLLPLWASDLPRDLALDQAR